MKKAILAICGFVLLVAMIFPATTAGATTSWPVQTAVLPFYVKAFANDSLLISDCAGYNRSIEPDVGGPGMAVVKYGQMQYSAGYSSESDVSQTSPVVQCASDNFAYTAPDGTVYTTETFPDYSSRVVAEKNGRLLWNQTFPLCSGAPYGSQVSDIQMGSDGKLYAVLDNGTCGTRLVELDPASGSQIGSSYTISTSTVGSDMGAYDLYTYSGEVAVITAALKILYFSNGSLTTPVATSTVLNVGTSNLLWANSSETLSTMTASANCSSSPGLKYRFKTRAATTASAYTFTMDTNCLPQASFEATILPSNGFVAEQSLTGTAKLTRYTVPTSGTTMVKTSITGTTPTGYSEGIGYLYADTSGKVLYVNTITDQSTGNQDVLVRLYDFTAGTSTVLWRGSDHISGENSISLEAQGSIYGGNLYQPICGDACSSSRTSTKFYKIALTGFGTEFQSNGSFSPNNPVKAQYVALGDSYSAGQGNSPYVSGTDISGYNVCHRSPQSYPMIIESTHSYDLTNDNACAGAKTTDVTGSVANSGDGNWSEGPQVNAVTPSTRLVTITIGGNDIGFNAFAQACVVSSCDESTSIYATTKASIDNDLSTELNSALTSIQSNLGSDTGQKVLVIGYPDVLAPDATYTESCDYLDVSEYPAIQSIEDDLNGVIKSTVDQMHLQDSRFNFVDANPTNSPFNGNHLCENTADPYFYGLVSGGWGTGTFHPTAEGQQALEQIIAGSL